jgi:hypothetical protein
MRSRASLEHPSLELTGGNTEVEVISVAKCVLCGSESELYANKQPVCLKCVEKREPKKKKSAEFIHVRTPWPRQAEPS